MIAYTKNHNLGLEVPYRYGSESRKYLPDFIVLVDDGHGPDDPLHLMVEIKGYRREDAKEKKSTMDTYWVPGVNHLGSYGRWAFAEFTEVYADRVRFRGQGRKRIRQDDRICFYEAGDAGSNNDGQENGGRKSRSKSSSTTRPSERIFPRPNISPCWNRSNRTRRRSTILATRDLDPQLVWRGKDEQDWSDLVVHAPPLYIQEKVQPKVLIDDLLRATKRHEHDSGELTPDLFSDFNGIPKGVDKTEFYQHDQNWSRIA